MKKCVRWKWDRVLELALIPFVLLLIGVWLQSSITSRQEDIIVTQMVDSYFEGIANHLTSDKPEISHSVVIARTRALFMRLNQLERKNEIINVIRFLSEANPCLLRGDVFEQDPQSDRYFIDLRNQDLSKSDINIMELEDVRFWDTNFNSARFYNFSCEHCGFSGSSFRNAEFSMISFFGSDMTTADFRGSNIDTANLEGVVLDGAKWVDGRICAKGSIGVCR